MVINLTFIQKDEPDQFEAFLDQALSIVFNLDIWGPFY